MASTKTAKELKELYGTMNKENLILTDEDFFLPSMGDMYVNSVDSARLNDFAASLEGNAGKDKMTKASFYLENPFASELGFYEKNHLIFVKAKPLITTQDVLAGKVDGDTLTFKVSAVVGDDDGKAKSKIQEEVKRGTEKIINAVNDKASLDLMDRLESLGLDLSDPKNSEYKKYLRESSEQEFKIRFLGINAPEVSKWTHMSNINADYLKVEFKEYGDIKNDEAHYYCRRYEGRKDKEVIAFVTLSDAMSHDDGIDLGEMFIETNSEYSPLTKSRIKSEKKLDFYYLNTVGETEKKRREQGDLAQRRVIKAINASADGYVYLMLNTSTLKMATDRYASIFDDVTALSKGPINKLKYIFSQLVSYNDYSYKGYNMWGTDAYNRFLGTPYVITDEGYVNLAKYVIAGDDEKMVDVFPDYGDTPWSGVNNNYADKYFNLASYDFDNYALYDATKVAGDDIDDRRKVQEEIFGRSFDELREWTVGIGDTFFFVPPTSINVTNEVSNERLRTMRSKGSMVKGGTKVDKYIELDLYFNDERGINGYPWETTLPNGDKTTYYMNGLRALISQFKFTPFLPIENRYINQMCNIEAVNLLTLEISTVEGFPRTLVARVVLQAFDWRTYMPDLPANIQMDDQQDEDEYFNIFAKSIDYATMRWYYQRAIRRGNKVDGLDANSIKYIEKTLGSNTALQPMHFEDSGVKFYVANEDYLKKMLQVKINALDTSKTYAVLTDLEKELLVDLAPLGKAADDALTDKMMGQYTTSLIDKLKPAKDGRLPVLTAEKASKGLVYGKAKLGSPKIMRVETNGFIFDDEYFPEYMNLVQSRMVDAFKDVQGKEKILNDVTPYYKVGDDYITFGVCLDLYMPGFTTPAQITNLIAEASTATGVSRDKFNLVDEKLYISYRVELKDKVGVKTGIDRFITTDYDGVIQYPALPNTTKSGYDYQMLAYAQQYKKIKDSDEDTPNEEVADTAKNVDYISPYTLTYDQYEMGHVTVQNISVSTTNSFMKYGLNGSEGYASQYMGSEDSIIEITLHSMDEYAVGMINQMTSLQTRYARDYRLILPACPFRIDTELTRTLGINEIILDKVEVSTVAGAPGLYDIHISAISMDRTLRSREALNKVNDWTNNGSIGNDNATELKLKSYDNLNETLAAAELYPDLELPTVKELESKGFNFIRHVFDRDRSYPDPDFYFVYGYLLQADVLRDAVSQAYEQSIAESTWTDEYGGSVELETNKEFGYITKKEGKNTKDLHESISKVEAAADKSKSVTEYVNSGEALIDIIQSAEDAEGWSVSPKIRVLGIDQYHQDLLHRDDAMKKGKTGEERQGKWLSERMDEAREASKLIKAALDKPLSSIGQAHDARKDDDFTRRFSDRVIRECLNEDFGDALAKLNFSAEEFTDSGSQTADSFIKILKSIATAFSSKKEWTKKAGKDGDANFKYLGYAIDTDTNSSGNRSAASIDDAVENGVEFSVFGLKMLKRKKLKKLEVYGEIHKRVDDDVSVNMNYYTLDPYYRREGVTAKEIEEYKRACCTDYTVAAQAFVRNTMLFLAKAIDEYIFPNITFDLMASELREAMKSVENKKLADEINDYEDFLNDEDRPINAGKLFICSLAAATNSQKVLEYVKQGRYEDLNQMVYQSINEKGTELYDNSEAIFYRKFFRKLVDYKMIDNLGAVGNDDKNIVTDRRREYRERVYIEAANNPSEYITHSFHDMTVNDMRGRMARAFPTFYMLLVDEGRRIGLWKLHDNFYNINSISEIAITKSRKNPADTIKITMSNMFHTYTTDDEDIKVNFEYDYRDVFNSIFNSEAYYEKEEAKRMGQQPLNRAKLKPGIRMHVRMGYNSNAATLPIMFNGRIAEVSAGETVEIVGQGDGVELLNTISVQESKSLNQGNGKLWLYSKVDGQQTPKEIFDKVLCNKGTMTSRALDTVSNGYYRSYNEYGIVHFGDPRYNVIFENGEPSQNIYEATTQPKWYKEQSKSAEYGLEEPPQISIMTRGRTVWDVFNIAASMSPDFILGIAPFGMRSTLFHGHPRFYYAYDYIKDKDGNYLEKRKPYQQFHLVSSMSDIIQNNITATSQSIATNAVGLYKTKFTIGEKEYTTGRLYVDWDIYPENQRSIVHDTGIVYKGNNEVVSKVPLIGDATKVITDRAFELPSGGKEKAWRSTAKALKHSIHDMYTGNIMLVGNPSIKPHDRLEIYDTYENISGPVLVESVTHIMSPDTGFVTDVVPDCIAVVDDRFETTTQSFVNNYIKPAMIYSAVTTAIAASTKSLSPTLSLLKSFSNSKGKQVNYVANTVKKLVGDTDKAKDASKVSRKGLRLLYKALNASKGQLGSLGAKLGLAGAVGGPAGVAALTIGFFVESLVSMSIGYAVNNKIKHSLRNKQVLEIYPIKKNTKVLTAGLTGQMGLVVGSPTGGMNGVVDSVVDWFVNKSDDNRVFGFVRDTLLADDTVDYMRTVGRRNENLLQDGTEYARQSVLNNVLASVSKEEAVQIGGLSELLLTPRVTPPPSSESTERKANYATKMNAKYTELKVDTITNMGGNAKIVENMVAIEGSEKIADYLDRGILRLIWKEKFNDEKDYEYVTFETKGENLKARCIKTVVSKKNSDTCYDIPFLHPDALALLEEICRVASNYLVSDEEEKNENESNFIAVTSAARIGDTESLASTGLSFKLESSGKDSKTILKNVLHDINEAMDEMRSVGLPDDYIIFERTKIKEGGISEDGKSVRITVYPPA
ncbi:hypothetical protein [Kurthia sp. Dielmo]|uniref:hypothetical protein n=1 Tax=Kurthia sp. Dielmo TaxID=1033738 RepID=UPI0011241B13|nr:hypothetical protein [Kurthia sp. Dielmo]